MPEDFCDELVEILRDFTGDEDVMDRYEEHIAGATMRNRVRLKFELYSHVKDLFDNVKAQALNGTWNDEDMATALAIVFGYGVVCGHIHKERGYEL